MSSIDIGAVARRGRRQQHRQSFGVGQLPHPAEDLLDHGRGQPEGRFVQHEQLRARHQRQAEAHHPLLTAGHGAGQLLGALLQDGQQAVDHLQPLGPPVAVGLVGPTQEQVVEHRQVGEHEALGGDEGHPRLHVGARTSLRDVATLERDAAGLGRQDAEDGLDGGALAAAVVTEDADDLTLVHVDVDVEHDLLAAIAGPEVLDDKDRRAGLAVAGDRAGEVRQFQSTPPPVAASSTARRSCPGP